MINLLHLLICESYGWKKKLNTKTSECWLIVVIEEEYIESPTNSYVCLAEFYCWTFAREHQKQTSCKDFLFVTKGLKTLISYSSNMEINCHGWQDSWIILTLYLKCRKMFRYILETFKVCLTILRHCKVKV